MRTCWFSCLALGVLVWGAPASALDSGAERDNVDTVIVHAIGGATCNDANEVVYSPAGGNAGTWKSFFEDHATLGIHYVIDRAGSVEASIPENQVANHALGQNPSSVGIELVNRGDGQDPYPEAQVSALATLVDGIRSRWDIPLANVRRHSEVDDRTFDCGDRTGIKKKQDPGAAFDWDAFVEGLTQLEADRQAAAAE